MRLSTQKHPLFGWNNTVNTVKWNIFNIKKNKTTKHARTENFCFVMFQLKKWFKANSNCIIQIARVTKHYKQVVFYIMLADYLVCFLFSISSNKKFTQLNGNTRMQVKNEATFSGSVVKKIIAKIYYTHTEYTDIELS